MTATTTPLERSPGRPLNKKSFAEACYEIVRRVPKGKVTTYQAVANALGCKAYRAVGNAMNSNPYAPEVPCHRVVKANGEVGGFARGNNAKIQLLRKEGIPVSRGRIPELKTYLAALKRL